MCVKMMEGREVEREEGREEWRKDREGCRE